MPSPISNTPTNIITGFLGTGKTTAILHLLQNKPKHERWAVLVNEFGEIGIDGSLFQSNDKQDEVYIKEVPGGCMCCTAGLPMQVALNVLLKQSRPHRLLIEPTGLGHPKEVLQTLSAEHYQGILDIQHTLTLVDARKITNDKYTGHSTFTQQLEVADVIIANKKDLYTDSEVEELSNYLAEKNWSNKQLYASEMAEINPKWLEGKAKEYETPTSSIPSNQLPSLDLSDFNKAPFPECGYISYEKQDDGFFSYGWKFNDEFVFDQDSLYQLISLTPAERVKGVFITNNGIRGFNLADGVLSELPLNEASDSRLELILTSECNASAYEAELLALTTRT